MWDDTESGAAQRERMSALVDGELDRDTIAHACGRWREDTASRVAWHAYHMIGDVLRSDDLACDPARDARFLEGLRTRLALEPVVFAPAALTGSGSAPASGTASLPGSTAASAGRWRWHTSAAVAAGFMVVAGTLTLTRPGWFTGSPAAPETALARSVSPSPAPALLAANVGPVSTPTQRSEGAASEGAAPETFTADGALIRDARLDRYLAAHQQFAGSSALGVPSAFLRNATADLSDH